MKTLKYNPQLVPGQQEHCWDGGHLHPAAFLVMFKTNFLLEEYSELIGFAKRKLN